MKRIDLLGQKFGRLTVLEFFKCKNSRAVWICKCSCGNIKNIDGHSLRTGHTTSCGCFYKETRQTNLKHGMCNTTEYRCWDSMIQRCYNQKNANYKTYGFRGISVCEEWKNSFESFYKDMGNRPKKLELDRIDGNGNYCKENCEWVTSKKNASHRGKPNMPINRLFYTFENGGGI